MNMTDTQIERVAGFWKTVEMRHGKNAAEVLVSALIDSFQKECLLTLPPLDLLFAAQRLKEEIPDVLV